MSLSRYIAGVFHDPKPACSTIVIREAVGENVEDAMADVESSCGFPVLDAADWTRQYVVRLAFLDGDLAGYLATDPIGPVRRLLRLVVRPEYRRKGIEAALVRNAQAAILNPPNLPNGRRHAIGLDHLADERDWPTSKLLASLGFKAVPHDRSHGRPRYVNDRGQVRLEWRADAMATICQGK